MTRGLRPRRVEDGLGNIAMLCAGDLRGRDQCGAVEMGECLAE